MMQIIETLLQEWGQRYGKDGPEKIIRSPGRINIIGEHTDYNDGWVMPGATSKALYILVSPSDKNDWYSYDYSNGYTELSSDKPSWVLYVEGALSMLNLSNSSFKILFGGDLPVGAGVSSSSALLCGLFTAFSTYVSKPPSKESIVLLAGRVEKEIIGLQGGIMDQFAILFSRKNSVMLLDCRTQEYEFLEADIPGCNWFLINTNVKHHLADSDYNKRSNDCKMAIELIRKHYPDVTHLRDATESMVNNVSLDPLLEKRALFVIHENNRVHEMKDALRDQDKKMVGKLLTDSHEGLRDMYEVSCEELDVLQSFLMKQKGIYGCRMMGGGFGGCVIGLADENELSTIIQNATEFYKEKFPIECTPITFSLGDGVTVLK